MWLWVLRELPILRMKAMGAKPVACKWKKLETVLPCYTAKKRIYKEIKEICFSKQILGKTTYKKTGICSIASTNSKISNSVQLRFLNSTKRKKVLMRTQITNKKFIERLIEELDHSYSHS